MQLFLSQLANCRDTSQILELVLAHAIRQRLGIKTIRYYRLRRIKKEEHLVSVDSAGHDDFVTTQLRLGAVTKVRKKENEVRKDGSFDVISGKATRPAVFQINPSLPAGVDIREVHLAPLPFYELRDDRCDDWLGPGATRDAWVDIPLRLGGRTLGKFSCSLDIGRVDPPTRLPTGLAASLVEFQEVASYLASFLESLRGLEVNGPLEEAGREIFRCSTYEELYRYCTTDLIRLYPFDYESADILVVARDTLKYYQYVADREDSELLILRGSSRQAGVGVELGLNTSYYRRDPDKARPRPEAYPPEESGHGLTPWVWRKGKSLRLNYDPDDPEFEQQLRAYDKDPEQLRWVQHIKAGEDLKSLLIVPIPAPPDVAGQEDPADGPPPPRPTHGECAGRRIIGVIRFANKRNRYIEPREEVLLRRIAERCLGPKMMSLRHETFALNLRDKLDKLNLVRLDTEDADVPAANDPAMEQVIENTLSTFLGDMRGKLALVNLRTSVDHFTSLYVGGTLIDHQRYKGEFALTGTLTGYLVRHNKLPYVFINDLEYAREKGHYTKDTDPDPALCALASTIQFGDDVFGGLVVLSKEFDILPTSYGRLIQVVAGQIGFLLARRAALEFASCVKGLRHDTQHLILPLRDILSEASAGRFSETLNARAQAKLNFWYDTIRTHCRTGPKPVADFIAECDNPVDISRRLTAAAVQAWEAVAGGEQQTPPALRADLPAGMRSRVSGPYLTICFFNLLKNAWEACDCAEVAVRVVAEDGWLVVRITNPCESADETRLERLRNLLGRGLPPSVRAVMFETKSDGVGLRLVQRLAEWHRLPDPNCGTLRRGQLDVEAPQNDRIEFVLRLPALTTESTPCPK